MNMNDSLRLRMMEIVQQHRGRSRAVPRDEIMTELRRLEPTLDDRRFRELYSNLPICTCPNGLYSPSTPQEVADFKAYLSTGWGPIVADRRVKVILAYYPSLAPRLAGQGELSL